MKLQAATGVSALSVGPGIDMAVAKKTVGDKCCLIGNIDPINVLLYGTPEKVYEESKRVIESGKENGGYIFNSGEMIPRDIPEGNMSAMIRAGRDFGKY
jgi:uroporphyrinogen decarboxylase